MRPAEGRNIIFPIRAGAGHPEEQGQAFYTPGEQNVMASLRAQLDGPDRQAALNSIATIHELKALMGAEIL